MKVVELDEGYLIKGDCTSTEVQSKVYSITGKLPLIIADPPYGNIIDRQWDKVNESDTVFMSWMIQWSHRFAEICLTGAAMYVWGGIGKPKFRPFYRYLANCENVTKWQLANHITWSKKRGYGVQNNYLFTREELAYFVNGDIKKPRAFFVPYLEEKRGYAGYNEKYPAKSEYYRRTNVWTDITEKLRDKVHINQKPEKLHEILINIHTTSGEWVFDPFAGSGTTGRAARNMGRRFVIVEKNDKEFDICLEAMR